MALFSFEVSVLLLGVALVMPLLTVNVTAKKVAAFIGIGVAVVTVILTVLT